MSVLVNVNVNVNGRIVVLPVRVSIRNGVNNVGLQQMRTLTKIRIMIQLNSIRQQQGSKQSFDIDIDVDVDDIAYQNIHININTEIETAPPMVRISTSQKVIHCAKQGYTAVKQDSFGMMGRQRLTFAPRFQMHSRPIDLIALLQCWHMRVMDLDLDLKRH